MLAERNTKWSERWEQRGMEKGRQEGVADALRKLLRLKFQELPDWAETKIQAADATQLVLWLEKVLEADSLEALFKE
ncbi:hypothetical protein [Pistricoccus aurantiacus]|uniref:hypothetical protein n=1 Tax=Pistricoccus aurantiacus TaxID=1883414 RepID=UPI0036293B84